VKNDPAYQGKEISCHFLPQGVSTGPRYAFVKKITKFIITLKLLKRKKKNWNSLNL
jgi:hypothetical protein